jgi:hypothetical protein
MDGCNLQEKYPDLWWHDRQRKVEIATHLTSLNFTHRFRLVVSAAHCFFREQPSSLTESVVLEDVSLFTVAVGKYFRDLLAIGEFKPQVFNISEVISVPGYDGEFADEFHAAMFMELPQATWDSSLPTS